MSKAAISGWRALAVEAIEAAKHLTAERPRAMLNRNYYALFAEAHACLLEAGLQPRPELGTWSHENLAWMVRLHLEKSFGRERARSLSQTLRNSRQMRELADYDPLVTLDREAALRILREATIVMNLGQRG